MGFSLAFFGENREDNISQFCRQRAVVLGDHSAIKLGFPGQERDIGTVLVLAWGQWI